ncbi:MAG: SDR family NAD(P)-dependent oxidoreductase [Bacteroidaceae bacterium]|nr:SDR family NAD(P)-dependent oxidoreductase [Bacteroidaceae bacterium]
MSNNKYTYAIVTGAASGMGRCYALQLAEMGYAVLLVDINGNAAQKLSEQLIRQFDVPAPVLCLDLTLPKAAEQIVNLCKKQEWRVEILINNAGMLITTPIEETEPDKLQRIMTLHCTTPLLLCRQLIPLMKEQGKGYILNISSITAWMDWPVIGIYGCTKRFVKGYSRTLRIECLDSPIGITTAIFGAVDTPLLGNLPFMRYRKLLMRLGFMISPEKATRLALKAMFRHKATLIPCISDRLVIMLCPLMPSFLLRILSKKIKL